MDNPNQDGSSAKRKAPLEGGDGEGSLNNRVRPAPNSVAPSSTNPYSPPVDENAFVSLVAATKHVSGSAKRTQDVILALNYVNALPNSTEKSYLLDILTNPSNDNDPFIETILAVIRSQPPPAGAAINPLIASQLGTDNISMDQIIAANAAESTTPNTSYIEQAQRGHELRQQLGKMINQAQNRLPAHISNPVDLEIQAALHRLKGTDPDRDGNPITVPVRTSSTQDMTVIAKFLNAVSVLQQSTQSPHLSVNPNGASNPLNSNIINNININELSNDQVVQILSRHPLVTQFLDPALRILAPVTADTVYHSDQLRDIPDIHPQDLEEDFNQPLRSFVRVYIRGLSYFDQHLWPRFRTLLYHADLLPTISGSFSTTLNFDVFGNHVTAQEPDAMGANNDNVKGSHNTLWYEFQAQLKWRQLWLKHVDLYDKPPYSSLAYANPYHPYQLAAQLIENAILQEFIVPRKQRIYSLSYPQQTPSVLTTPPQFQPHQQAQVQQLNSLVTNFPMQQQDGVLAPYPPLSATQLSKMINLYNFTSLPSFPSAIPYDDSFTYSQHVSYMNAYYEGEARKLIERKQKRELELATTTGILTAAVRHQLQHEMDLEAEAVARVNPIFIVNELAEMLQHHYTRAQDLTMYFNTDIKPPEGAIALNRNIFSDIDFNHLFIHCNMLGLRLLVRDQTRQIPDTSEAQGITNAYFKTEVLVYEYVDEVHTINVPSPTPTDPNATLPTTVIEHKVYPTWVNEAMLSRRFNGNISPMPSQSPLFRQDPVTGMPVHLRSTDSAQMLPQALQRTYHSEGKRPQKQTPKQLHEHAKSLSDAIGKESVAITGPRKDSQTHWDVQLVRWFREFPQGNMLLQNQATGTFKTNSSVVEPGAIGATNGLYNLGDPITFVTTSYRCIRQLVDQQENIRLYIQNFSRHSKQRKLNVQSQSQSQSQTTTEISTTDQFPVVPTLAASYVHKLPCDPKNGPLHNNLYDILNGLCSSNDDFATTVVEIQPENYFRTIHPRAPLADRATQKYIQDGGSTNPTLAGAANDSAQQNRILQLLSSRPKRSTEYDPPSKVTVDDSAFESSVVYCTRAPYNLGPNGTVITSDAQSSQSSQTGILSPSNPQNQKILLSPFHITTLVNKHTNMSQLPITLLLKSLTNPSIYKPVTIHIPFIDARVTKLAVPQYKINAHISTRDVMLNIYNKLHLHESHHYQIQTKTLPQPFKSNAPGPQTTSLDQIDVQQTASPGTNPADYFLRVVNINNNYTPKAIHPSVIFSENTFNNTNIALLTLHNNRNINYNYLNLHSIEAYNDDKTGFGRSFLNSYDQFYNRFSARLYNPQTRTINLDQNGDPSFKRVSYKDNAVVFEEVFKVEVGKEEPVEDTKKKRGNNSNQHYSLSEAQRQLLIDTSFDFPARLHRDIRNVPQPNVSNFHLLYYAFHLDDLFAFSSHSNTTAETIDTLIADLNGTTPYSTTTTGHGAQNGQNTATTNDPPVYCPGYMQPKRKLIPITVAAAKNTSSGPNQNQNQMGDANIDPSDEKETLHGKFAQGYTLSRYVKGKQTHFYHHYELPTSSASLYLPLYQPNTSTGIQSFVTQPYTGQLDLYRFAQAWQHQHFSAQQEQMHSQIIANASTHGATSTTTSDVVPSSSAVVASPDPRNPVAPKLPQIQDNNLILFDHQHTHLPVNIGTKTAIFMDIATLLHDYHQLALHEVPARALGVIRAIYSERLHLDPNIYFVKGTLPSLQDLLLGHGYQLVEEILNWPYNELFHLESFNEQDVDTYSAQVKVNEFSALSSLVALGGALAMCRDIVFGKAKNGFAITRPPGHHTNSHELSGFCVFGHVASIAKYATKVLGLQRVLIFDWDIHYGNGTSEICRDDPSIVVVNVHSSDTYPFLSDSTSSSASATGIQAINAYRQSVRGVEDKLFHGVNCGVGTNIDVNIFQKNNDEITCGDYLYLFDNIMMPILREYAPQLIIVSAGFDAARGDTLGTFGLSPECYAHMISQCMLHANGKVLACLEGGYNVHSISMAALACIKALSNHHHQLPPLRPSLPSQSIVQAVQHTISKNKTYWRSFGVATQATVTTAIQQVQQHVVIEKSLPY